MAFKIENYEGTADTFTFPNNSTSFDDSNTFEFQRTDVPFNNKHIFITTGSLKPKTLTMQGYFTGSSKEDNYRDLLEHAASPKLKKFYFESDKFYLVLSPQFKKTHTGGRTNFLDYVGSFVTPIPFIFGDTQKTSTYTGPGPGWSSATNDGTHKTFIESFRVFSNTGFLSSTTIYLKDAYNGGIEFSVSNWEVPDYVDISLIKMVDTNGFNITEYWYVEFYDDSAGTTTALQRHIPTGRTELDMVLKPGDNISAITTNAAGVVTAKFRDSYL